MVNEAISRTERDGLSHLVSFRLGNALDIPFHAGTFPYMETLNGYEKILIDKDFVLVEKEDLSGDFARHCHIYQNKLRNELKESIISNYGDEWYQAADDGLNKWVIAADEGKVGRARLIGKKM